VKDKRAYFIATSTGLYATDSLQGAKTIWTLQSPEGIGNTVCSMIDSRPGDGLVVVGTHGNGAYSSYINYTYQVTGLHDVNETRLQANQLNIYPNPMRTDARISLETDKSQIVNIAILDEQGRVLSILSNSKLPAGRTIIPFKNQNWKQGIYYLRVTSEYGNITKAFLVQ
jgi:hypothetical protein